MNPLDKITKTPARFVKPNDFGKRWQNFVNKMLTQAVEDFSTNNVRLALTLGADPNIYAQIGNLYPLVTRAARSGNAEILRLILSYGGNPNAEQGKFGPIHMAALKGMDDSIRLLHEHGANIDARYTHDMDGTQLLPHPGATALYLAAIHEKTGCAHLLQNLGATTSGIGPKGENINDLSTKRISI